MQDNKNISIPQSGMIRDKHPSTLQENEYPFALNANIEGEDGSISMRQNEPSNIKCMGFDGYKVIGYKNDIKTNNTYFFITHPINKTSKIIFFESNEFASSIEDLKVGDGVDIRRILGDAMEYSDDRYTMTCGGYAVLIEDSVEDPCLNFSLAHPIKTIEIKAEKCGNVIYWTDDYNPPRWVSVEKALNPDPVTGLYWYRYHGYRICGDNMSNDEFMNEHGCILACEKLRIFPFLDIPCITAEVMEFGGSLRAGVYQFCVALCDQFGNEMTNYHSLTDPVHVFDRNDILVKDGKWGARTSLGIRLDVSNLDNQAMYYKVGVLQKTVGYNGEAQPAYDFLIEGIHPITEQTIYYVSDLDCTKTSLSHLSKKMPVYKTSKGITTAANHLIQYGLTAEPEWNLQPVCNFLGHFLRWQTSVSLDSLYQDGVSCAKYCGFMRDEVYPFSISFLTTTGYETPIFPLIPRPKNSKEAEEVSGIDVDSIQAYVPNCTDYDRRERWQFENTAVNLSKKSRKSGCNNEIDIPRSQIVEKDIFTFDKGGAIIDFSFQPEYLPDDILGYIESNPDIICETAKLPDPDVDVLCNAINGEDNIEPPAFPDECHDVVRVRSKDVTTIPRALIKGFSVNYTMKTLENMKDLDDNDIYNQYSQVTPNEAVQILFKDGVGKLDPKDDFVEEGDTAVDVIGRFEDSWCSKCDRSAYGTMALIAQQRRFSRAAECTIGCSPTSSASLPEVYEGYTNLINLSRITGYTLFNMNVTDGSHTDKALRESMKKWEAFVKNIGQDIFSDISEDLVMGYGTNKFTASLYPEYEYYIKTSSKAPEQDEIEVVSSTCFAAISDRTLFFFNPHVSQTAKWYKIERPDSWDDPNIDITEKSYFLEVYGTKKISPDNPSIDSTAARFFRLSFFSDENGTPMTSPIPDNKGTASNSNIFDYNSHNIYKIDSSSFKGGKVMYIAVDSMICAMGFAFGREGCDGRYHIGTSMCTAILPAEIGIGIRKKEVEYMNVRCTSLTIRRAAYFEAWCTSCGDTPLNCDPRPYEYGDFGYWQSLKKYPANYELYDSTKVRINAGSGSEKKKEIISKLTEYYGSPSVDDNGFYFTGSGANYPTASPMFCQQNIRHYKFPNNIVAPFMASATVAADSESYIYPLGIMIDEEVISAFLDIAVDSKLITQEQRDTVNGYKIYRGDRTLNRSVLGTGIGFDMYKYKDSNDNDSLYANYPYNDLSDDRYIYADENRLEYIHHPYNRSGNTNFMFHSPDFHFNKPELGTEIQIEGYQTGYASGLFTDVEDYPKYVLLGPSSISYAKKMARIEALAKAWKNAIESAMNATASSFLGLTFNLHSALAFAYLASTLANVGKNYIQDYNRIKNDWMNILSNRGIPDNFAYYYSSKGYYNSFIPVPENQKQDVLRGLQMAKYLDNGKYTLVSPSVENNVVVVNNTDRESAVFLSVGEDKYIVNYPLNVKNYDSSRVEDGGGIVQDVISGSVRERGLHTSYVASPYIKMKRFIPTQYGGIENIKWVSIGYCGKLDNDQKGTVTLYGGDTFISRFSVKRKFPMFYYNAFGLADLLPFCMNDYRNIGYPKYFLDYETKESTEIGQDIKFKDGNNTSEVSSMPFRESSYNLNKQYGDWYLKGKFYTYFYGIPQFLVESEINCNERLRGVEPHEGFFPAVGDYVEWTQQKNVPINRNEEFMISPIYMARSVLSSRMLPATYEKKFWDCAYQRPNGVIWSRSDNSENSMTDPWLHYKPLDVHEFPSKFGKLIHLKGIESEMVLGRFENQVSLFNTVDTLKERMPVDTTNELGTGGLFSGRAMDYNQTDLGYSGTQSTEMVSCEYGHFWVDAKRGQVFMVKPNGEGLQPVHPGMSHWLQEHLPFKILKSGIVNANTGEPMTYDDVDNKFAGLGLSLGWDNRFKRVFVTKKDYIPVDSPSKYKYKDSKFYYNNAEVDLTNPNYFLDVSFTLAYSCKDNTWISYYSFTPDYYIEHLSYFQTGKNFSNDYREEGLWSHLLTTQSYQVFYGKRYPFMIELPVKEQYVNKILSNIQYHMEARRYQNEIDFAVHRTTGFNKAWVYNYRDNSGLLNLIPEEKNNWAQKLRYPKVENGGTSIIATEVDDKWMINDFFNRVKNNMNNIPQWIKDVNDIEKEINAEAVYYNSIWKDRLRGDWFLVRYSNDAESRFKMIFRWQSTDEKMYNNK